MWYVDARRHLSRRHEAKYNAYQEQKEQSSSTQSSLTAFVVPKSETGEYRTYNSQNPHQKFLIQSLVNNVIINCALPVSLVDNPHFKKFLHDMDPKFTPPCRQTITYSYLPQFLKEKKAKLEDFLKRSTDVALTTDVWTDRRSHAFLGVTVHTFLDGVSSSQLLAFRSFPGVHSGQRIADELESVINEFELAEKLRFIVSDNASNMKKAMHLLFDAMSDGDDLENDGSSRPIDKYFDDPSMWEDLSNDEIDAHVAHKRAGRIPCFAHSLQLVIRDGLQTVGLAKKALAKCSKLASLVHQSARFRSSFEGVFGSGRSIPFSNETWWNSTFRQLKAIADLDQPKLTELLNESSQESLLLSPKDLQQIQELVEILTPFAEATDFTQGDKTITVSCVIPIVLSLNKMLKEKLQQVRTFTPLVRSLNTGMSVRFFGLFHQLGVLTAERASQALNLNFDDDVFLKATALDPKFGFQWLQDHPGSVQEKESIHLRITGKFINIAPAVL